MRSLAIMFAALNLPIFFSFYFSTVSHRSVSRWQSCIQAKKDSMGYEIKDKSWFDGLSLDAGASLTDPRAIPPIAKEFAEKIKSGGTVSSISETIKVIDEWYDYFEVPFKNGDIENPANVNKDSAKIFSFALLNKMNEEATLRLFGPLVGSLSPGGSDHPNVRNFLKLGWSGIQFGSGLAIVSKLQAYEDTDSAMATQAVIEGSAAWDPNADSWIP